MSQMTLRFDLLTYWHAGTGRGAAAAADAVVFRDEAGLPCLPGRTVRGLVRAAMERAVAAGVLPAERLVRWFGSPKAGMVESDGLDPDAALEEARFATEAGCLWFGSARLPDSWARWAAAKSDHAQPILAELTTHVASTAVGADGTAQDETLRVSEVAVPMTLRAIVRGPDDPDWQEDLKRALPLLRSVGSRRNRGYGRVRVVVEGAP